MEKSSGIALNHKWFQNMISSMMDSYQVIEEK